MNIYVFSTLAASFVNLSLAIIVFLHNPREKRNIVYSIFCLFVGVWAFACFLQTYTQSYEVALFAEYLLFSFAIFTPAMFVDFINTYTKNIRKGTIFAFYLGALVLFALNFTPLFRLGISNQIGFRYVTIPYIGWHLFNIFYTICATTGLLKLYVAIREIKDSVLRMQLIYLFAAFLILVTGGSFYLLFSFSIKTPPIDNLFNVISGILVTYTITKHRLMNIFVVISRSLAWLLTVSFLGSVYVSVVWIYRTYVTPQIDLVFLAWTILYGILVGETFQRLRLFLQTTTDKTFVKGWYDYRRVQREVSVKLERALSKTEIIRAAYPVLNDEIDIRGIDFFFRDEGNGDFVRWKGETAEPDNEVILKKDDPFVSKILNKRAIFYMEKEDPLKGALCLPSFSENDLLAFVVLGKKRSEEEYTNEDLDLFQTIQENITMALEYKIKPYEEVKAKFEATERKLAEAEKQLERSQRLASLGTVSAGVAHEIRNPLGIIQLAVERLTPERAAKSTELGNFKSEVTESIQRITNIVRNMLSLSPNGRKKRQRIDLNEIIETTLRFFVINRIKLVKELNPVPRLLADPEEMKEIFINLIDNAMHAMPEGGTLKIKTYAEEDKILVEVSDTGKGIPKEDLSKVFDPFFSTYHEKAGLGLSIVYRIVREHEGEIEVKSQKGRGTTFVIRFPERI